MTHHLVILKRTYLRHILDGTKTVECRFSKVRRAPFGAIRAGDVLWLKLSGGPIVGIATAAWVEFLERSNGPIRYRLPSRYTANLRADAEFLSGLAAARFATFIGLSRVRPISPMSVRKSSRHGWVVLPAPLVRSRSVGNRSRLS